MLRRLFNLVRPRGESGKRAGLGTRWIGYPSHTILAGSNPAGGTIFTSLLAESNEVFVSHFVSCVKSA